MVISHDIPRILGVADRVIVLLHGSVALEASAGDVNGRDIVDAMVGYHEPAGGRG
jgi:ABC-type sugar transport system ATPase subunit